MMSKEDIEEFHNLDKLKQYHPLPTGLTIATQGSRARDYLPRGD